MKAKKKFILTTSFTQKKIELNYLNQNQSYINSEKCKQKRAKFSDIL